MPPPNELKVIGPLLVMPLADVIAPVPLTAKLPEPMLRLLPCSALVADKFPATFTVPPDWLSRELPSVAPLPVKTASVPAVPLPVIPPPEPVPQLPLVVQTVLSTAIVILPAPLVMLMPLPCAKPPNV